MRIAGANPKEIASTSESSSSPNRLPVFVARATRPSIASHIAPTMMYQTARSLSPRSAVTMASTPKKRFARVKLFGSITIDGRGSRGRPIRAVPPARPCPPRAKTNEPDPLPLPRGLAHLAVGHNAPGDRARDLTHEDEPATGREAHRHLLVVEARLGRGRVDELARIVVHG